MNKKDWHVVIFRNGLGDIVRIYEPQYKINAIDAEVMALDDIEVGQTYEIYKLVVRGSQKAVEC